MRRGRSITKRKTRSVEPIYRETEIERVNENMKLSKESKVLQEHTS